MISINDLVTLAKAGWTPKQVKEVYEMVSTSPTVDKEAAPEKLKEEVEIKEVEELPKPEKPVEDDSIETLKKLLMEEQ